MATPRWLTTLDQQGVPVIQRTLFNLDHVVLVQNAQNLSHSLLMLSNGAMVGVAHSPKEIEELMSDGTTV